MLSSLIGIPWLIGGRALDGIDCVGLMLLAQATLYKRVISDAWGYDTECFFEESYRMRVEIEKIMNRVIFPKSGDVILFEFADCMHLGTLIEAGRFLHVFEGERSKLSKYNSFYGGKTVAVYRPRKEVIPWLSERL